MDGAKWMVGAELKGVNLYIYRTIRGVVIRAEWKRKRLKSL